MAETQYSIRVVKHFPYRGNANQQFSNRYHFDGSDPGSPTAWHDLMDALVLIEKTMFYADVVFDACFGYAPGSNVAVASKTFAGVAGTGAFGASDYCPGDCAAVARWATTKRSIKNHPVYCFSYWHGVFRAHGGDRDTLLSAQQVAMQNYATDWNTGISVGGRTYKRTTPDGHPVTGALVETYVTHRDFPR